MLLLNPPKIVRLPVTIEDESEMTYPDMMTADVPLFSKKLKTILDDLGVNNINYFPVELFNEDSEKVVAHYYLGIIGGLIKCLKSGVETNAAGRIAKHWRRVKLANGSITVNLQAGQLSSQSCKKRWLEHQ